MPGLDILLTFLVTTALFAYIPGPSMLYAAARTLAGGRRAGLMAALGIHLGCNLHVAAAAGGLSVIFHAVPTLYLVVKLAGAAYLVWLGVALIRGEATDPGAAGPVRTVRHPFRDSMLVEMLNPKTALFFLAFLPQFIDPAAAFPVWLQFLILGTLVNIIFSIADIVCVLLAGAVIEAMGRSDAARRLLRRAGGAALVGLGAHLALQRT